LPRPPAMQRLARVRRRAHSSIDRAAHTRWDSAPRRHPSGSGERHG
jgi:hypothetical protein